MVKLQPGDISIVATMETFLMWYDNLSNPGLTVPQDWDTLSRKNVCVQRRCFLILLIQLSVITLVLILPQVDLLDAAFQNDSEPLAIHAFAVVSPLVLIASVIMAWMFYLELHKPNHEPSEVLLCLNTNSSRHRGASTLLIPSKKPCCL
jgi:hypothetical protein